MHAKSSGGLIIYFSLFITMCLNILPWSNQIAILMPNWTLLTLLYWSIALPHKVSIGTGWTTGLLFDVLTGSMLGQNTLIFSIAAYFGHQFYSRIRNNRIWQQAIFIVFFFLFLQLLSLWISQLNNQLNVGYQYWLQAITSGICWPIMFAILRLSRRRFRVQ
ncbi:MAG: rod shape-determining protein MreD [Cycloclasticus sp.]|nr:MAG: rod shape-determining protein MreD [Cycloclasticus sp.]